MMIVLVYHLCLSTVRYVPAGLDDSDSNERCTFQSKHILECRNTSPDSQFLDTSDPHGISVNVSTIENAVKDPLNFDVELPVSYSFLSPTSSQVSFPSNSTNQVTFPEYCETKQVRFSNDAAYSDKVWLVCVEEIEGSQSFSIYQGTESFGTITWQETIFQFLQLWPFADDGLEFRFYKISINKMNAYDNWMMTRIDFLFDTAENPTKILGNFIFLDFFGSNKLYFFNNVNFEKYSEPKTDYFQNIFVSSSSVSGFDEWTFPSYSAYSVGTSGITTLYCTRPQECTVDYYIFSDFSSFGNNVSPRQTITISNLDLVPDNPSKWIDASPPSKSIGIACSTTKISENGKCFHQVVILPNNNGPGVGMDKYYAFTFETDFVTFNDVTIDLASTSEVYAFRKLSMIDFELDDHTQSFFDDTRLVNGEGIDFMYEVSSVIRDLPDPGLFSPDIPKSVFMRILRSQKNWDDYTNIFYIYLVPFFSDPVGVQFEIGDADPYFRRPNTVNKISGIEKNLFLEVSDENIFQQCEYDVSILDLLGYFCGLFQAPCSSDIFFETFLASDLLQLKACTFHLGTAGAFHFDYSGGQNIIIKESFEDAVSEDLSPIQKVQMMNIHTTTSVDLIVGPTESVLIVSTGVESVHESIEVPGNRICLGRRVIEDDDQFLETKKEFLFLYYIVDDDTDPTNYVFHSIGIPPIRGSIDPSSDFIRENATLSKTSFPATFDLLCNQGEDAFFWDVGIFDFDTGFADEVFNFIAVEFDNYEFFEEISIQKLYVIENGGDDLSSQISSFQEEQLSSYDLIDIEFRTHITDSFVSDISKFTQIAAALFEDSGNYTFCSFSMIDIFSVLQHHCFDFSPEYRNFTEFECGHLSLTVTQRSNQERHETQSSAVSFMCNGTNDDGDLTRSWFYSFESKTLHLVTDDDGPFDTKATTGYDTVFMKTIPDTTGKLNNFEVVGVDHNDPDDIFFATRYNIETGNFSVSVTSNYDASEEWKQNALADAIQVTFPVAASLTISLYSREDPNYQSPFVSSETQENTLDDSNSPVSNFGPALQFEDLSQFSRLAIEKKITQANIIVQENVDPFHSIIRPSYTFPILDDDVLGTLSFFPSLESNFTLLLEADNKQENNIFNFLDGRNVLWTECPENNENSFAFFTTDSLTSCNVGPPSILSNFDQNAAARLSTMRLEQTIDDNIMLCFGASSVVYGNECGQHPLIHTSTEDCATEDDPFVCVDGNNEIFAFDTVVQNVTTLCLSMSGTCAAIGAFTPDDHPGQTLEECRELCVTTTDPTATCAFFEHVNEDCTLYLRSDVDDPFLGEPCENGVLGFICRLEGSDDVLSSQLILNDGDDIAFRTEIYQGQNPLGTIPHGEIDASTMKMDRSGKETAFVLEFQSSFNVTGGQVIYVCGQDEDVYNEDSTDDRVLFTHPASEDDHFVNTTVQECYISTHSLTFHEKRLANSADPTMRSCIDKQASGVFFAQGVNEDGPFKFYNIKPSTSTSKSSGPATSSSFSASVVDEQWTPYPESLVTFAVPPGKNLSSVIAYSSPSPYAPNDRFSKTYWKTYLVSPTDTAPNEIRPVRLENVEGAGPSTVHGAGASVSIDPSDPLFMFGIENSIDPDISDVLWGRFLNFKAYFFQEKKTISKSEEIEFIHKYIFSMSEAFSRKMCPGFDVNNTNTSETFPDGECVMTRLSHPVMRPLFSEQVRMRDGTLALGFTPYRVAPFMGVYIDDDSTERMVMPDDAFIEEHGGIGFGAASSIDEFENQTVYSFGGFDYGPDPTFRPFEKLQFTTDDPTLQWQPVWHRESQTFGCKDDTVQCTYSEDFYDNVLPQSNLGTVHHKLSTQMHVTGHAHSPNEFWHFVTQRNFQFPSVRDSAKCGPGDVTVNLNRLDDVNTGPTLEKINESDECNNELKIRVPLTPEKDVDFSSDNSFFDSQTSVYNFFISPVPDDKRINLMTMLFQNTRKNPEFLKLWPALLNLSSFDTTNYKLLPLDTTQTWAKECIAKRGVKMHEHEGTRNDGHYSDCYPQDTGTMLFLFKDRPENTAGPWVANDCNSDISSTTILDRFQYKKQNSPNQYSWEIEFSDDTDIFDPSAGTPSQTYWTIEGGAVQAFLYFLNNTNSDIPFLARECEVGNLALIKMIGFFDAPNTQFENPNVMFEKYNPDTNGDFDLSKVYTPGFFTDVFDCLHTTIYLGHNNDHLKQFCNERQFSGEVERRFSWYNVDETSTPTPGNINTVWPKVSSGHKFKFPSKVVNGFTSASDAVPTGANSATCGKEMCLSPFPALLPPFQRNCDFYNLATLPSRDIEWRKCPMMPNPDFYESSQTNGDTGDDIFFKRQIWRHPAFWSKDSGVWSSKAYRYNINKFDPNPKKIKKVFKSVVDGALANSTVIGQLQCSRSGGVSKQSIIDPDLFYICGGVSYTEILSGCSLCEVFNVNTGKGASITGIDATDFSVCGNKNIIGLDIQQGISSPTNPFALQWVVGQFSCAPDTSLFDESPRVKEYLTSYLSIPDAIKEIHHAKTRDHTGIKSVSFHQVELVSERGTMRALPLYASSFSTSMTGPGSVCFESGKASVFLEYKKAKDGDLIASISVNGLDVTASTSFETTVKHITVDEMTCIDANGITESNGTRIIGFWMMDKVSPDDNIFVNLEILTLNTTEYSFSSQPRSFYFDRGSDMQTQFSNIRWKTTKGFHQNPEPPVVWACKVLDSGPVCGSDVNCSSGTGCIVEYYDDASSSVKDETELNIGNNTYQDFGYLDQPEQLHCYSGSQFKAYPLNFTLVPGTFGQDSCDEQRKLEGDDFQMVLVQRYVLERMKEPHFTEGAPRMMIRTSEACSDNTTQCHTFQRTDLEDDAAQRLCFHAVGCEKDEYVNVTSDEPEYECEAFEKCTEFVTGKYQNMGTHAGFRPECTLVQACSEPGFYRHHSPFDTELGQVVLGQCQSKTSCGSTAFTQDASTALKDSTCVEFQNCDFSTQFQSASGDRDQDRQCIETTTCTEEQITLRDATRTSDTVCVNVSIQCEYDASQFFDQDSNGCKDATICGVKEIETAALTATTDRVCTQLPECSFYEVEVPGSGLQFECLVRQHASKTEEIAMMAAAGSVGILSCLFYLLFPNQDDTRKR